MPAPPDIYFPPFDLPVPVNVIAPGFVCLSSALGRKTLSLDAYLATDVGGHDVMLGVPAEFTSTALKHYLNCKSQSQQPTTLSALIDTTQPAFPRWRPLLHGMKNIYRSFCCKPCLGWLIFAADATSQQHVRARACTRGILPSRSSLFLLWIFPSSLSKESY